LDVLDPLRQYHQQRNHTVGGKTITLVGKEIFLAVEDFQIWKGLL
jgi:hypothetical protein